MSTILSPNEAKDILGGLLNGKNIFEWPMFNNDFNEWNPEFEKNYFPENPNGRIKVPEVFFNRNYYIVCHNRTYDEEIKRGLIWGPSRHRPNMNRAKKADIVFHYVGGYIKAVSVVLQKSQDTYGYETDDKTGIRSAVDAKRLDCFYYELDTPLDLSTPFIKRNILVFGHGAFRMNGRDAGRMNQGGFIHPLSWVLVGLFISEITKPGNVFHRP